MPGKLPNGSSIVAGIVAVVQSPWNIYQRPDIRELTWCFTENMPLFVVTAGQWSRYLFCLCKQDLHRDIDRNWQASIKVFFYDLIPVVMQIWGSGCRFHRRQLILIKISRDVLPFSIKKQAKSSFYRCKHIFLDYIFTFKLDLYLYDKLDKGKAKYLNIRFRRSFTCLPL